MGMTNQKTVLVIEDDPINMKLATFVLEHDGYRVLQARDGASGLALARETVPDLILLDIRLPDMTGYEVHQQLRQDRRLDQVKILAFTASIMLDEEARLKVAGFDAYISKPIEVNRFREQIRTALAAAS